MRSVLALLAVFVGFGVACGDEGGEELSGPERYIQEKTQYFQVFCTCAEGETEVQPASSPCVRGYLGDQTACEEDVLEEQWDDLEGSAECLVAAYEEATECLTEACAVQQCLVNFQNDTARCSSEAADAFGEACNSIQ